MPVEVDAGLPVGGRGAVDTPRVMLVRLLDEGQIQALAGGRDLVLGHNSVSSRRMMAAAILFSGCIRLHTDVDAHRKPGTSEQQALVVCASA